MGNKPKLSNWNKRCPNQYKTSPSGIFKTYAQLQARKSRVMSMEWRCRETDKLCGYYGRELECSDNPSNPNKQRKSGLRNYLSSLFSKKD